MRWYFALGTVIVFASPIGACREVSSGPVSDVIAYRAVLRALEDSVGSAPVWVQPNPVLVSDFTSAPGDRPEHFVPQASQALAEAVSASTSTWRLCADLGAACLTRPGRVLALSELTPHRGDTLAVWASYAELFQDGHQPPWQILYFRVALYRRGSRWMTGVPELLGGEP